MTIATSRSTMIDNSKAMTMKNASKEQKSQPKKLRRLVDYTKTKPPIVERARLPRSPVTPTPKLIPNRIVNRRRQRRVSMDMVSEIDSSSQQHTNCFFDDEEVYFMMRSYGRGCLPTDTEESDNETAITDEAEFEINYLKVGVKHVPLELGHEKDSPSPISRQPSLYVKRRLGREDSSTNLSQSGNGSVSASASHNGSISISHNGSISLSHTGSISLSHTGSVSLSHTGSVSLSHTGSTSISNNGSTGISQSSPDCVMDLLLLQTPRRTPKKIKSLLDKASNHAVSAKSKKKTVKNVNNINLDDYFRQEKTKRKASTKKKHHKRQITTKTAHDSVNSLESPWKSALPADKVFGSPDNNKTPGPSRRSPIKSPTELPCAPLTPGTPNRRTSLRSYSSSDGGLKILKEMHQSLRLSKALDCLDIEDEDEISLNDATTLMAMQAELRSTRTLLSRTSQHSPAPSPSQRSNRSHSDSDRYDCHASSPNRNDLGSMSSQSDPSMFDSKTSPVVKTEAVTMNVMERLRLAAGKGIQHDISPAKSYHSQKKEYHVGFEPDNTTPTKNDIHFDGGNVRTSLSRHHSPSLFQLPEQFEESCTSIVSDSSSMHGSDTVDTRNSSLRELLSRSNSESSRSSCSSETSHSNTVATEETGATKSYASPVKEFSMGFHCRFRPTVQDIHVDLSDSYQSPPQRRSALFQQELFEGSPSSQHSSNTVLTSNSPLRQAPTRTSSGGVVQQLSRMICGKTTEPVEAKSHPSPVKDFLLGFRRSIKSAVNEIHGDCCGSKSAVDEIHVDCGQSHKSSSRHSTLFQLTEQFESNTNSSSQHSSNTVVTSNSPGRKSPSRNSSGETADTFSAQSHASPVREFPLGFDHGTEPTVNEIHVDAKRRLDLFHLPHPFLASPSAKNANTTSPHTSDAVSPRVPSPRRQSPNRNSSDETWLVKAPTRCNSGESWISIPPFRSERHEKMLMSRFLSVKIREKRRQMMEETLIRANSSNCLVSNTQCAFNHERLEI